MLIVPWVVNQFAYPIVVLVTVWHQMSANAFRVIKKGRIAAFAKACAISKLSACCMCRIECNEIFKILLDAVKMVFVSMPPHAYVKMVINMIIILLPACRIAEMNVKMGYALPQGFVDVLMAT